MSVKNLEVEVSLPGKGYLDYPRPFTGIRELGFNERGTFVIDTYTTPYVENGPRGGYFTTVPISNKEYRRQSPTKAGFKRLDGSLLVYNDWAKPTTIVAPKEVLDQLAQECVEQELPERS